VWREEERRGQSWDSPNFRVYAPYQVITSKFSGSITQTAINGVEDVQEGNKYAVGFD
jgi:hypothetical protein